MFSIGPPWLERLAALLNRRLIYEFDDAMHLRPPFASDGYRWVDLNAPAEILRKSRAAVVGSPWLVEFASRHCDCVRVIPTCLDTDALPVRLSENHPLVVGWIGTRGGFLYLNELAPVIAELQREHGFVFRVVSNGTFDADGLVVENIPWSESRERELLQSFDIGIMPLAQAPFERGKAGFKLLQYLTVGSAAIASPVGVNIDICGEDEERALMATSPADWRRQIGRLLTDEPLRRRLAGAGPSFVKEHFDIRVAVDRWEALLRELTR
jgi:glycosyltransferase involved in cell wall biosynthesis